MQKKKREFCKIALQTVAQLLQRYFLHSLNLDLGHYLLIVARVFPPFPSAESTVSSTGQNNIGCRFIPLGSGSLCSAGTCHLPVQPRTCFCWAAYQRGSPACDGGRGKHTGGNRREQRVLLPRVGMDFSRFFGSKSRTDAAILRI